MLTSLLLLWLSSLLFPNTPLKWEECLHLHLNYFNPGWKIEGLCSTPKSTPVAFKLFDRGLQQEIHFVCRHTYSFYITIQVEPSRNAKYTYTKTKVS